MDKVDELIHEALNLTDSGQSVEELLQKNPEFRTDVEGALKAAALLKRAGHALEPARHGLATSLRPAGPVRSPLSGVFFINNYVTMYTKLGATLVAIIVIAGGVYYLAAPKSQEVATTVTPQSATLNAAAKTSADSQATLPPATDSFDDFQSAMSADAQAQQAAVQSSDMSTNSAVESSNTTTSSTQPYDPSTI